MKTKRHINPLRNIWSFIITLSLLLLINLPLEANIRQIRNMDFNWKFILGDHSGAEKSEFNDNDWRILNVPHDWGIESGFSKDIPFGVVKGYLPSEGIGWYRKSFELSSKDLTQTVCIEFDGVYMNSDVWLNGHHLGHYPNGYLGFHYELTPYAKKGKNEIAIRVDNSLQPNSRWYSGAGIYRHVRLVLTDPLHVGYNGVYITTPKINDGHSEITISTSVENNHSSIQNGTILSVITNKNGIEIAKKETPFSIGKNDVSEISQDIIINNPALWSPETPELYVLHTYVKNGKKIYDEKDTRFGIREIEFLADKGFILNGTPTKIKGVCLHHTAGCLGSAVPEEVWIRYLKQLKEMGCNAIRTAHNPFAPEFLAMCDSIGFLVMAEAFDEWKEKKGSGDREVTYGYHTNFDKWGIYDLIQMIHRDRNNPSIVIWSVGNEIPEQLTPNGYELLKKLVDVCHTEDPTRPVTSACNFIGRENTTSTKPDFLKSLDIIGYNYVDLSSKRRELLFTTDKMTYPEWKMIGSENSAIYSIRGDYSLGNDLNVVVPSYHTNMIDQEQLWKYIKIHDFVMGDFIWTGIDYLGEAEWPYIGPPTGVIDRCGFPKDAFYFYQSMWTEKPMVHIFPHWNWPGREGQIIPVVCYTNCDAVELFLNDKSFGEKRLSVPRKGKTIVGNWLTYDSKEHITTADLHLSWDVPYEPGVIKAVGKKNGEVVCSDEIRTTGEPASIRLSADQNQLISNKPGVAHLKVEIIDKDGQVVPYADNLVEFIIEGQGKLIGVDNGDPLNHNSFKLNCRNAFHGVCLAIVQANGKAGKIKITARSEKLGEKVLEINLKPVI